MTLRRKPLSDRYELVVRLREEEGLSFRKIGERLGVSRGRAGAIYAAAQRNLREWEEHPNEGFAMLPLPIRRWLKEFGFHSRSAVLAAVELGELWWDENDRGHWEGERSKTERPGVNLARMPTCTRKKWAVLCEWLDLPAPDFAAKKTTMTCPHCGGTIDLRAKG